MQCSLKCSTNDSTIVSPPYCKEVSVVNTNLQRQQNDKNSKMSGRTRYQSAQQKALLMGSLEDMAKNNEEFVNPDDFLKSDSEARLLTLITSINKIHLKIDGIESTLSGDDGLCARVEKVESKIVDVSEQGTCLESEVKLLKGIAQRQEEQIGSLMGKVSDIQSRMMSENLIITGIIEFEKEQELDKHTTSSPQAIHESASASLEKVLKFLNEVMKLPANSMDIYSVYRIGEPDPFCKKDRQMFLKCNPKLREDILQFKKERLVNVKNGKGLSIYINTQEPEAQSACRKQISHEIRKLKAANKEKAPDDKVKFQVKKQKLFVAGKEFTKVVQVSSVSNIFTDPDEQEKLDKIRLSSSDPMVDQGNVFTGFAAKASNITEVSRAYKKLKQLYPSVSHIAMAYDCQKKQGNQDDGEHSAGLTLEKLLISLKISNRAVFVVRNASLKKLGPKRFEIMEQVARQALSRVK